ncbi:hypothetical protein AQUCO_02000046v1 [Aquilegia coerulea]|uniref:BSD domain-containing protein n=1 Tax=Aquilegia coerulea TaxID=218851 RepID=A0A2G5DGI2_AQUCA|nr:hypothetical protein AQUCO_02000046v1 [Aquilegia coerulea]
MSSWLSLPISNPFKSEQNSSENQQKQEEEEEENQLNSSPSQGGSSVKEDLSELGKTLSRQLWGVASFLAPPPSPPPTTTSSSSSASSSGSATEADVDSSSSQRLVGIRNDFAEISGSLKSGFSLISTNKAVNEISRLASNLLQFDEEDDKEEDFGSGIVGITEEALEFVKEISLRPECWIDFPLSLDDKDFDMSNAQKEHALRVEHMAPSLADLRMKLCPNHMKEENFWLIYFILLHPRLNKHDSELLSTPQIVEARDILLQTVRNRRNENLQTSKEENLSVEVNEGNNAQQECNPVQEKKVLGETVNTEHQEDVDVDQWLEEDVETGTSFTGRNQLGDEQDVSFSDLEDDDNDSTSQQGGTNPVSNVRLSSPNDSSGWVQLSESSDAGGGTKKAVQQASRDKDSEGEGSSEWLTIDESDSDSVGTS